MSNASDDLPEPDINSNTLESIDDITMDPCDVTDIPLSGDSIGSPTGLVFRELTNEFLIADQSRDLLTISVNPGVVTEVTNNMGHQSRGLAIIPLFIGGELLPIDKTALLLAGFQTNAIWMLPIVMSAVGIGAFVLTKKK